MKPVRTINIANPIKVYQTDIVIDEDFDFESKIIFISNLTKMNPALESRLRGVSHAINFTKKEMLELIKNSLYNMYAEIPEITNDMRDVVFEFATQAIDAFNDMDYRSFNYLLTFKLAADQAGQPDSVWQKRAFRMLKDYGPEFKK